MSGTNGPWRQTFLFEGWGGEKEEILVLTLLASPERLTVPHPHIYTPVL